jgi:hypothetical protein
VQIGEWRYRIRTILSKLVFVRYLVRWSYFLFLLMTKQIGRIFIRTIQIYAHSPAFSTAITANGSFGSVEKIKAGRKLHFWILKYCFWSLLSLSSTHHCLPFEYLFSSHTTRNNLSDKAQHRNLILQTTYKIILSPHRQDALDPPRWSDGESLLPDAYPTTFLCPHTSLCPRALQR